MLFPNIGVLTTLLTAIREAAVGAVPLGHTVFVKAFGSFPKRVPKAIEVVVHHQQPPLFGSPLVVELRSDWTTNDSTLNKRNRLYGAVNTDNVIAHVILRPLLEQIGFGRDDLGRHIQLGCRCCH